MPWTRAMAGWPASMSRVSWYTSASISACGARLRSTWKTGDASNTSPWWRSFTTSARRTEARLMASGTMRAILLERVEAHVEEHAPMRRIVAAARLVALVVHVHHRQLRAPVLRCRIAYAGIEARITADVHRFVRCVAIVARPARDEVRPERERAVLVRPLERAVLVRPRGEGLARVLVTRALDRHGRAHVDAHPRRP